MPRKRISRDEMRLVYKLEKQLGERRFRDLMQRPDKYDRPIRYERLGTMKEGRALISDGERRRLELLNDNAKVIQSLGRNAEKLGRRDFRVNKALRDWLLDIGTTDSRQGMDKDSREYKRINFKGLQALGYLGVDDAKWKEYISSPEGSTV